MKKDVEIVNESWAIVQTIQTGAVVKYSSETRSTTPLPKEAIASTKIAIWGDDNAFPQNVIKDIDADHELGQMIADKASLIYSGGLTWGIPKIVNGEEILDPIDDKEDTVVRKWLDRTNINQYMIEAAMDLETFANGFVELVLQRDKSKIVQICIQAAENCRFEKMGKDGRIRQCRINANYPEVSEDDPLTKKLPVLDPYYSPAENLRKQKDNGFNF